MISVSKTHFPVFARVEHSLPFIDVFKESKRSGSIIQASENVMEVRSPQLETIGGPVPLDFRTWLPFAAPGYHLSSDPKDYIMVPVIIMPADLPNRNKVAFPLTELVKFNHELGQQAYKTWKGKPTYYEHKNDDITQARGVIADTFMRRQQGFGNGKVWKILTLLTFDRSKYPEMVQRIEDNTLNSYSMGAWVGAYTCSYCGAEVGKCMHIDDKKPQGQEMYELNGHLVFKNCKDVVGFETSAVETPAFSSAISDAVTVIQ